MQLTTYLQPTIARVLLIALLLESCSQWNVPIPQLAQSPEQKVIKQKSISSLEATLEEPESSVIQVDDSRQSASITSETAKYSSEVDSKMITISQAVTSLPPKPLASPLTYTRPPQPRPAQPKGLPKANPVSFRKTYPATTNRLLTTNSRVANVATSLDTFLHTPLQWKSREGHQLHKLYVVEDTMYAQVSDQDNDQPRYVLPVYIFPGVSLSNLATYPMEQRSYYLHILLPTKQGKGQVVFSQGGLLGGGGKEGNKNKNDEAEDIKESKQEADQAAFAKEKEINSSIALPPITIATLSHLGKGLEEGQYLSTALTILAEQALEGDTKAQQRLIKKLAKLGTLASLLEKQPTILPMRWREKPLQELQAMVTTYYEQALDELKKDQKGLGASEQIAQELTILGLKYHYYQLLDPKEVGSQALFKELIKAIDQLALKKLPASLNLQRIYLSYLVKTARQLDLQNNMKELETYMEHVTAQIAKKAEYACTIEKDVIESKSLQQLAAKHYRKLGDISERLKNKGQHDLGKSDEWQHSYYLQASNLKDPIATYRLGLLYEKKSGLHASPSKAQQAFEESAQAGYSLAEHKVALYYEQEGDADLAKAWHQRAASQGHPLSLYTLYVAASKKGESSKIEADEEEQDAQTYLVQAAQAGHAQAQHVLGNYYWEQKQYEEAVKWYLKAAEQGIYEAYVRIGVSAAKGLGSKQDFEKALDYYVRAEKIDKNPIARYGKARLYEKGKGVTKDLGTALQLYTEASMLGYAKAAYHAGRLHLLGEIVGSNPQKGYTLLKQAAEGYVYKACLLLGRMQEYGWGRQVDLGGAVSWYQGAASNKNSTAYSRAQALYQLGWLYRLGKGVAADEATALSYFEQAALVGKDKYVQLREQYEDSTKQLQEEKHRQLTEKEAAYKKLEEELKKVQEESKNKQNEQEIAYKKLQGEAQSQLDAIIKAVAPNGEDIVKALAKDSTSFNPMYGGKITEVDMNVLVNHPRFKHLTRINITRNYLNSDYLNKEPSKILATHLQRLPSLEKLYLNTVPWGTEDFKVLAAKLAGLTNLRELILSSTKLGLEECKDLAASLRGLPKLIYLFLDNNQLGAEGVKELTAGLKGLLNLEAISLQNNQLRAGGVKALAASLKGLPKLRSIFLKDNQLGLEGGKELAASLAELINLETLFLDNNQLGVEGVKALAASLRGITKLQYLNLDSNQLGAEGAKALAASLVELTNLENLALRNNQLGDAGVKELAASLKDLPKFKNIYLNGNNISSTTQEELKKQYPGILWDFSF